MREPRPRRPAAIVPLLLLPLLAAALYLPFAGNGYLYDDFALVLEPPALERPADLPKLFSRSFYPTLAYYRPLASAAYQVERALLGDAPGHFHAVNALLAGAAALAAFGLLRRPALGLGQGPAWVVALLFAIHPVTSSCALAVSGRDTLLVTACMLAALDAFSRAGPLAYGCGLALTAAALLTKEVAVGLPLLLLALDLSGLSAVRPRSARAWLLRYLGPAFLLVGYFVARAATLPRVAHEPGSPLDVALSALYTLQVAIVPFRALLYEPLPSGWFSPWRAAAVGVFVAVVVVGFLRAPRDWRRRGGFWCAWFAITLAPSANLLAQETRFAERYALLPTLAPLALAASLVVAFRGKVFAVRGSVALAAAAATLLAAVSFGRGAYWEEEAFYRQWTRHDPTRATAFYNLANTLVGRGRLDEAIEQYRRALEIRPAYGDALNNLGAALVRRGDHDLALERLGQAVEIAPGNPKAHNNLGLELVRRGRTGEAIRHFEQALRIDPAYADAHLNLAGGLVAGGNFSAAVEHFEASLRLEPGNPVAHNNLGSTLATLGRIDAAMEHFRRAVELQPGYANARVNLGHGLVRRGRAEQALEQFRQAIDSAPDFADAHYGMATALLALGRDEEARARLERALRLQPDHTAARRLLRHGRDVSNP